MSAPDWSKAPIDATHYGPENNDWCESWLKRDGDDWFYWDIDLWANESMTPIRILQAIPRPAQWRGPQDGLPPVGMEVECMQCGIWIKGTVSAVVHCNLGESIIVQHDTVWMAYAACSIRPIQPDRDRAIQEIAKVLIKHEAENGKYATVPAATALYDAGYRKP